MRLLWLTLILLLAAAARLVHIDNFSLWVDEGLAWYHAHHPDLLLSLARDTHPPLYFAALRVWALFAGQSELGLRLFSLLPSMLSVALMYPLAGEFVRARGGSPRRSVVPLLAMLMMALADAEIFMSQEVRHYTWHVLFVVCSMYCFLRWIRTQRRALLLAWVAFTVLLVYTHYIGAFSGIVQGVYALAFLRRRTRLTALAALLASALMLAPWLLVIGVQQVGNNGANWSFQPSWALFGGIVINWFSQQYPLMIGLAFVGMVNIIYDSASRWRVRLRPLAPALLLALWVIIPVALTLVLNAFIPLLSPRRMTQITPAVALLFAFGLGNFRSPARGFLVAVVVVYGVLTVDFSRFEPDWRAIARLTTDYAVPGDLALTDIGGGDYQLLYYYAQLLPPDVTTRSLKVWRDFEPETYGELGALIAPFRSVWLAYWSDDGQVFGWLSQYGFTRTAAHTIDHLGSKISVYRFDVLPETPAAQYDNGMALRQVALHPQQMRVDLWWSADRRLRAEYTTSAFLLDSNGALVAQFDSFPADGARPTSGWQVGEVVYDAKWLSVSGGGTLAPGQYQVGVQVYTWTGEGTQRAATLTGDAWAVVGTFDLP